MIIILDQMDDILNRKHPFGGLFSIFTFQYAIDSPAN